MDQDKLERIQKMEEHLNVLEILILKLNKDLDKMENSIERFNALKTYYMSDDWREDFEASNQPDFPSPAELPHGILSEDGIWNLIDNYQRLGDRMVSLGLRMKGKYESPQKS